VATAEASARISPKITTRRTQCDCWHGPRFARGLEILPGSGGCGQIEVPRSRIMRKQRRAGQRVPTAALDEKQELMAVGV
jgi:hypothetical protein